MCSCTQIITDWSVIYRTRLLLLLLTKTTTTTMILVSSADSGRQTLRTTESRTQQPCPTISNTGEKWEQSRHAPSQYMYKEGKLTANGTPGFKASFLPPVQLRELLSSMSLLLSSTLSAQPLRLPEQTCLRHGGFAVSAEAQVATHTPFLPSFTFHV